MDLPPELRDEVYLHFFDDVGLYDPLVGGAYSQRLQLMPAQIRSEMTEVFKKVTRAGGSAGSAIEGAWSSKLRIGIDLGVGAGALRRQYMLTGGGAPSSAFASQVSTLPSG